MRKRPNLIRLTPIGKKRIQELINNMFVNNWHKQLLKAIYDRCLKKNLSKSDCELYNEIDQQYKARGC